MTNDLFQPAAKYVELQQKLAEIKTHIALQQTLNAAATKHGEIAAALMLEVIANFVTMNLNVPAAEVQMLSGFIN